MLDTEQMVQDSEHEKVNPIMESQSAFLSLNILVMIINTILIRNFYYLQYIMLSWIISSFLEIVKFYIIKQFFGYGFVGLRWYINCKEQPQFPFVVYFAKPLPFVAKTGLSNTFWVILFINLLYYIVMGIFYLTNSTRVSDFLACFIYAALNGINMSMFIKCHNVSRTESDAVARNILLESHCEFLNVDSDEELDDDNVKQEEQVQE